MEIRRKNIITVLLAVSLWLPLDSGVARAQEQGTRNVQGALGTVEFRVSCTVEAQESFTRGVALLHSFTYEESAEAFRKAGETDPRCAMAHWGLAMTEYHQLWEPYAGPAELKRGTAEIQKARESKAETPRESDYIEALGVFYDGWEQRDHAARAKAYQEAMRGVQERNPKDQEASIFLCAGANGNGLARRQNVWESANSGRDPRDSVCCATQSSRSGALSDSCV